jgi:hypothetical protein
VLSNYWLFGFALYWPLAHSKSECDWPPVACYFCMRLAVTFIQNRQFFASTLPEQLFELENEDAI